MHVAKLCEKELQWIEDDVFVPRSAVVQELQRGPVIVHLPNNVGQSNENHQHDAKSRPAREEDFAFMCAQQTQSKRDQEERHGGLVE
jgi:hypothetical protein